MKKTQKPSPAQKIHLKYFVKDVSLTMKKVIAILLAASMMLSGTVSAYAAAPGVDLSSTDTENVMDANIAATLAMLFVGANLEDVDTWTMKTKISSIDELYDNEDNINAYCINFCTGNMDSGYVIISADVSAPLIQEYGTDCQPIYKTAEFTEDTHTSGKQIVCEKVYYAGPMSYSTAPNSIDTQQALENTVIDNEEENLIEGNLALIDYVSKTGTLADQSSAQNAKSATRISDPLEYLKGLYPSWTFTNAGYYNMGDSAIAPYYITETNACAMYAISAILKYHLGSKYSFTSIKNTVLQLFKNSSYSDGNATGDYYLDNGEYKGFTNLCLAHYGLSQTASSSLSAWDIGKSFISRNRPVMLNIWSAPGGNYSDHTVTAYAWTQFVTVSNNITYKFFKVRDGYTTNNVGRYVYFNSMAPAYVTTV